MRVIDCLSFAANLGDKDKFDSRAHKCVFLGYTYGFKGYKLYDLNTKSVFHSRDVLFPKTVYPFKATEASAPMLPQDTSVHITPTCEPLFAAYDSPLPSSSSLSNIPSSTSTVSTSSSSLGASPTHTIDSLPFQSVSYTFPIDNMFSSPSIHTNSTPMQSVIPEPPIRKSQRPKGPPAWLKDFVCPSS